MIARWINAVLPWLRYWHYAAIGVLLLALGIQGHRVSALKSELIRQAATLDRSRAEAAARAIFAERESARISIEKDQIHEKAVADLRAAAARRLQALTGRAIPLPRVPDAAFQPDAGAGRDRLCIQTPNAVALMLSADENTRQLIDLQAWIREQQKVSR